MVSSNAPICTQPPTHTTSFGRRLQHLPPPFGFQFCSPFPLCLPKKNNHLPIIQTHPLTKWPDKGSIIVWMLQPKEELVRQYASLFDLRLLQHLPPLFGFQFFFPFSLLDRKEKNHTFPSIQSFYQWTNTLPPHPPTPPFSPVYSPESRRTNFVKHLTITMKTVVVPLTLPNSRELPSI